MEYSFFSHNRRFFKIFEVQIKPSCDHIFTAGPDLMCPSSWALNSDDFPFFWILYCSSRTRVTAVWSSVNICWLKFQQILTELQTALTLVLYDTFPQPFSYMILGTIRAPALWLSHLPRISWFGSMQHIVLYCLGLISHWLYSLLIRQSFCWGPKIFSVTQSTAVANWFWSDKSAPQWGALIYIWAFVYGWASTLIEIFTVIC